MKNLSLDFKENNLIDLCELVTDGSHHSPPSQVEGYYMASVKDMGSYNFNYSECRKISKEDFDKLVKSGCAPKNDDIVIAKDGSPLSNLFIFKEDHPIVLLSSIAIIRTNSKKILPKFLKYYLENPVIKKYIQTTYTSGSVIPRIILKDFKKFPINYPNIENQNKIINILDDIDKKIVVNQELNKNLEHQLSLIFNEWFIKCTPFNKEHLIKTEWGNVPKYWKDINFGELIEITSGDRPKEKSEDKTLKFNIPLFGASKIMGYTKEVLYDEDILIIGRVGTHGVVQRVNYPCFPSDNTFVIKSKYYGFVYQLLKRIDYDSLNTGSTQPLITQKSLKNLNVILPDENILSKFEMLSKVIFDRIYLNNNEIVNLIKLRDTLLPKLMSGEIDVSKLNTDLKIIIRTFILNLLNYFMRYLNENKNYIKNTESNETLFKSRTIYKIDKFIIKFTTRYRFNRQ